ncbi:MAG: sodium:alanine symporter family protein [candidate division Zixibacteria bacterium]|nr:sodium:alanine symporter family protein [Candidatus Tariuqbacter arcticus]
MIGLENILKDIGDIVWGVPMVVLLFGTHLYLTFRLKFIQRYIGTMIKISFKRKKEGKGDISQFGALATELASTIGTGNIIGVSTAIAAGGPGAVLWMWLTGVFGMSTKYAQSLLSVKYRVTKEDGSMAGGPMYVLERALNMKWLGMIFAGCTAIAAFGIGNMVQSNAITSMLAENFEVPPIFTGIVLAVLTGAVVLGGIKFIAKVCERLIPFMAIFYLLGCTALLLIKIDTVPDTLTLIFKSAFSGQAAVGGFIGVTMKEVVRFGIARGLFSNESGLGSAPIVAAAAQTKNPVRQALVCSSGTFWDTVVVCAFTGTVIVNSGQWILGYDGAALTSAAFADLAVAGKLILTIGLLTFAFSTILGWSYYGEKAAEYLFGSRIVMTYRWIWVAVVMVGALSSLQIVWSFADIANAMMAIPNLISVLLLTGIVVKTTDHYLWKGNLEEEGD